MSTIAKFTGWVQGRNHAPTPIEMTGHPLPYSVITDVRVTGYFPALEPHEVAFRFPELAKDDFTIGSPITITIAEVGEPQEASVGNEGGLGIATATGSAESQPESLAAALAAAEVQAAEVDAAAQPTSWPPPTSVVTTTVEEGPALVAEANTNEVAASSVPAEFPSD